MRSDLLIVARQAGTAAAFAPVARDLQLNETSVYAYPPAAEVFETEGIPFVPLNSFQHAILPLNTSKNGILLTGTSLSVADDARWWSWARTRNITSMAFVDQWCNYRERFSLDGMLLPVYMLPERIIVVDKVAEDRMVEVGLSESQIVVAGTPTLDRWFDIDDKAVEALGDELRGPENALLLLYVCEPDPAHWTNSSGSTMLDRSFQDRIKALGKAAEAVAATRNRRVKILVRPHPIQLSCGFLHPLPPSSDRVCFQIQHQSSILLAQVATAVVGHSSMLLYESASFGIPTIALLEDAEQVPDLTRASNSIRITRHASLITELLDTMDQPVIAVSAARTAGKYFLSASGISSLLKLPSVSGE